MIAADSGSAVLSDGLDTGSGVGEVVENVAEGGLSVLGEEGGIVAIVILAVLAASLMRGTKRIDSSDWLGSVLKTTWIPFVITLALAFLAGYLIQVYFPG